MLLVAADLLGRPRGSGWGAGLATAVKLTPGIFLAHLLVTGQWNLLRRAAAWAAAATVAKLVLLWPSSPTWLTSALWDSGRFGRNDIPGNQSVRGMLLRALPDDELTDRLWVIAALLLLVVALSGHTGSNGRATGSVRWPCWQRAASRSHRSAGSTTWSG